MHPAFLVVYAQLLDMGAGGAAYVPTVGPYYRAAVATLSPGPTATGTLSPGPETQQAGVP